MGRIKVLLIQDVMNLGQAGEVYRVAGGYARNYLMPRGMAVLATSGAMKQADDVKQAGIRRRAQEKANAEAQAQVIRGKKLLFHANAGENDRLYGSVTAADIAERLSTEVGFDVDRRRIVMDGALRELGKYGIELRLMADVVAPFTVAVGREGEGWDEVEARAARKEAAVMVQEGQEVETTAAE